LSFSVELSLYRSCSSRSNKSKGGGGGELKYTVNIRARSQREALIAKGVAASSPADVYNFHEFRNRHFKLPVVQLPIDLPVYRMQNFRTFTDQAEYIANEGVTPGYFSDGQEIESVQQIQHEMLAKLAIKGVADSVAPVFDVLRRDGQREPLLITATGVVVNGNRRLAAMRELYAEDQGAFSKFSHIDFAVLPADATLADVVDVEAALQAKQETRLDYDWVGDAQLMKAMVLQHGGTGEVAKLLNRSDKEIRNTIQALAEADVYLKEWVGVPGHYSIVREEAEQLFKDIPKRLEDKEPNLRKASRVIAWTLFENRDKLTGRIYNYNAAFGKLATDVLDRVADELGVPTEEAVTTAGDDFAVDFGDDDAVTSYDSIIDQLRDPDSKAKAVEVLVEAVQNAIEIDKGKNSERASLKAVGQAHAKLMAVDISRAAVSTHGTMRKQLEGIEQLARLLIKKLDIYKDKG
jgi:hypothetical protein